MTFGSLLAMEKRDGYFFAEIAGPRPPLPSEGPSPPAPFSKRFIHLWFPAVPFPPGAAGRHPPPPRELWDGESNWAAEDFLEPRGGERDVAPREGLEEGLLRGLLLFGLDNALASPPRMKIVFKN